MTWGGALNGAEGGRVNLAELCRVFGISRQTGYVEVALGVWQRIGCYREIARIYARGIDRDVD